jgi:hypothetical protein
VLTGFIWFGNGQVARFCEYGNEPFASLDQTDEDILDFLSDY